MTLDTSAVLAILRDEPEQEEFAELIEQDPTRLISTTSVLEATIVLEGHRNLAAGQQLDLFLHRGHVRVVPFDGDQLGIARAAFRKFGKGRHVAGLNFGDCAVYALSQWSGEPLLFKGDDFAATDVARVR